MSDIITERPVGTGRFSDLAHRESGGRAAGSNHLFNDLHVEWINWGTGQNMRGNAYDLKGGKFTQWSDVGQDPHWFSDSRRLFFVHEGKIWLLHTDSGVRQIVVQSKDWQVERRGISSSRDDKWIYFSGSRTDSEVWLGVID